jgi:hypothetical protein
VAKLNKDWAVKAIGKALKNAMKIVELAHKVMLVSGNYTSFTF